MHTKTRMHIGFKTAELKCVAIWKLKQTNKQTKHQHLLNIGLFYHIPAAVSQKVISQSWITPFKLGKVTVIHGLSWLIDLLQCWFYQHATTQCHKQPVTEWLCCSVWVSVTSETPECSWIIFQATWCCQSHVYLMQSQNRSWDSPAWHWHRVFELD